MQIIPESSHEPRRTARALLGALLALIATAALSAPLFKGVDEFELPPRMSLSVVGDALRVNGVDTRIYSFRSDLSADEIAAHFSQQWPQQIKRAQAGPWDVLSHRQGDQLVTVQITDGQPGQTQGFIAAAKLFEAVERGARARKLGIPLLPRTQVLQDIEANDLGHHSRTLILLSEQSAAQNLEFYRAHFRAQGFVPVTRGSLTKGSDAGAMMLNRGSEQLNLAVAQQEGKTVVAIVQVQP